MSKKVSWPEHLNAININGAKSSNADSSAADHNISNSTGLTSNSANLNDISSSVVNGTSKAVIDPNSTKKCIQHLINVFNGMPTQYQEGSPMDKFMKKQVEGKTKTLAKDELHKKAAEFFLNNQPLPKDIPKKPGRKSLPILRYIVFQELPVTEPPVEITPSTSKPEVKKPKCTYKKPYCGFRELCGLSSDLGMSQWTDSVTDRVKRRRSNVTPQQPPLGSQLRQIKKEKLEEIVAERSVVPIKQEIKMVKIKEEPMSFLIEFERNLGQPTSFTLPGQIQNMEVSNQNGNDENNSVSAAKGSKKVVIKKEVNC